MTVDDLLEYIFSQNNLSSPAFLRWVRSCERFKTFIEKYKDKIRKKVKDALKDPKPNEKLKDVLFELETAYLMLKNSRFSVEYEQYGDKGPDFTVTDRTGEVFNVEVKRIRKEDSPQVRFDMWKAYIREQVYSIPSILALYIKIGVDFDTPSPDLVDRLEDKTSEIISYITTVIPVAEREILVV